MPLKAEATQAEGDALPASAPPSASGGRETLDALAAVSQGVLLADVHQLITWTNQAFTDITGYTAAEILGKNCRFLQGGDTDRDVIEAIRASLRANRRFSGEILNYRKDGSAFWNDLTIDPRFDDHGRVVGYVGITRDITERKRAAEENDRLLRRLERVEEIGRVGGWEFDLKTGRTTWTKETYRIHDLEPGDELGAARYFRAYAAQGNPRIDEAREAAVFEATPWDIEFPITTALGREIWLHTRGEPVLRDGKVVGLVGNVRDVTAARQAAERARRDERRFRAVIDAAPVPFAINDEAGRITFLNPAFTTVFGYTPSELPDLASWWPKAYPDPAHRAWVAREWERRLGVATETNRAFEPMELNIRAKDGSIRHVVASAAPLGTSYAGEHLVILLDVTTLQSAADALAASEAQLRRVLTATQDGWWEWDLVANHVTRSPRWLEIFGYDEGDLSSVPPALGDTHPEDRERVQAAYTAAVREGAATFACEYRHLNKAGEYIPVMSRVLIARDAAGNPIRLSGTITDLRERKIAEAQLAEAQKLEAIGKLTGGIAHDFNNLLGVLIATIEQMAEEKRGAPDRIRLERMLRIALQGADLTERLLAFARRQPLRPQVVEPRVLFGELEALCRRTLGEKIEIAVEMADDVSPVFADPTQLQTALLNLALNARDAMPHGGKLVFAAGNVVPERPSGLLAAGSHTAPARHVAVSVADTGEGMPAAVLARATEPFFTTKEVGKGTGLGLSMVYGFARQSGGWLDIASEAGRGTRVTLALPVALHGAETARAPARGPEGLAGIPAGVVLIVEDEPELRLASADRFGAWGFTVLQAGSADEALALIAAHPNLQVLFSDINLPGTISGLELARRAKSLQPQLRVLLTSGYTPPETAEAGFALLRKPYRVSDLLGKLKVLLARD